MPLRLVSIRHTGTTIKFWNLNADETKNLGQPEV
jgi:hypothetical protein